jgi:hypothetical protein
MTKPRLGLISLLLVGGAAIPWLIQRQSDIKTINSLQTQLDQLTQQRTGDESSSKQLAQAVSPLPNDQSNELLKLRNEVNLLRNETNELSKLRAENRQPRSDQAAARPQGQLNLAAGDVVPVESLTFAGYATPEAGYQSTLSAMAKGDFKTSLEGLTPEGRQFEGKEFVGKSDTELAAMAAQQAARFAGTTVRILASRAVSDDETQLVVFLSAENDSTSIIMKRTDGQWKISDISHHPKK